MFDFGGLSDFTFGLDSIPALGWGSSPVIASGAGSGAVSSSGVQTVAVGAGVPWYQTIMTAGLDGFKSWLNFDLAQQQVAAGQSPSQNASVGNLAAQTAGSLSGFVPILILVLVIAFGWKLLTKVF